MHTRRLTVNDDLAGVWISKFAGGQVCMYIISKCNNICLTTNTKKLSVLDLFMQICLTNTNFHTQFFPKKNRSDESLPSILHVRSTIMLTNNAQYHQLVVGHNKIDATPIFAVSRIDAKSQHCSRGLKIGLASIFWCSNTNRWYASLFYSKILDCLRNMGAELPVFRILHANPCARKTYPKMAYVLRAHGFACKIRNTGSSATIFR